MIDDKTIASMSSNKIGACNEEEDDDYLEDSPSPKASGAEAPPQWLDSIEMTCNNFLTVGQELQNTMVKGARQYADELSVESAMELLDSVSDTGDANESGASELGGVHSMQVGR